MTEILKTFTYRLPSKTADKLKQMAKETGQTPTALVRQLISAFVGGEIKIPPPKSLNRVYKRR